MNLRDYKPPVELSDAQLIELFSNCKPVSNKIYVVSPLIDHKTPGGVDKTDEQIEKERIELNKNGVLVVGVGGLVEEILKYPLEIGERLMLHMQTVPGQMLEKKDYISMTVDAHWVQLIIDKNKNLGNIINPLIAQAEVLA